MEKYDYAVSIDYLESGYMKIYPDLHKKRLPEGDYNEKNKKKPVELLDFCRPGFLFLFTILFCADNTRAALFFL